MKIRNRSLNYRQSVTSSYQCSMISQTPKSPTLILLNNKQSDINQEFIKILAQSKKKMFNRILRAVRGRNNPIKYQNQFEFLERWQTINKQNGFHNINYQMPQNMFGFIINLIFLLQKTIVVWFLSVYRLFSLTNITWPLILGILFTLFHTIWKSIYISKHYLNFKKQTNQNINSTQEFKSLVRLFSYDIYILIYFVISLFSNEFRQGFLGFVVFDFLTALFEYHKGEKLYKKIKLFGIRSAYRNYINLFDLISNLIIIFHFCAIFIYSVTLYSQNNWISSIRSKSTQWYSSYIYSLYFTSTTMLTVGYGDILPTNKLQIVIILMMQILGTATNGYIFSEVGHTLSKIRQKKQTKQKDISDTEKLAKVYRLDKELSKKMREYIINNQMENQELNVEEENNLLHKLNDELRTQVNNYNHMQIVKQNIFFLFYFSKKAQSQFAKRLQRKLFTPNETICQIVGKQKLFIVTKGRLQIYTDRRQGMRFFCKKKLKQIKKIQKAQRQISDNIFGYSTIIWGKPTNLRAVTKDFTVIYNLEKSDIVEVINDDSNDFESFFQLKEKIMLQKYPERWQVPRITSIREHYAPSIFFLIKKQKSSQKKLVQKNRQDHIRSDNRCKRVYPTVTSEVGNNSQQDSQSSFHSNSNIVDIDQTSNKIIRIDQRKQKYLKIRQLQLNQFTSKSIVPRSYKRKYVNNKKYDQKHRQQLIQKWQLSKQNDYNYFDVFKNYNCFFKKRNLCEVIKKINSKDTIQTQLTMVGDRMNLFHSRRKHIKQHSNLY